MNKDKRWGTYEFEQSVQVVPVDEYDEHQMGPFCPCRPFVQMNDQETGLPFERVIIVHKAFDGRHMVEDAERIIDEHR